MAENIKKLGSTKWTGGGNRPANMTDDKGGEERLQRGAWEVVDDPAMLLCVRCDGYGWNAGQGAQWEDKARRTLCGDCHGEGWVGAPLVTVLSMNPKAIRDRACDARNAAKRRGEETVPIPKPGLPWRNRPFKAPRD